MGEGDAAGELGEGEPVGDAAGEGEAAGEEVSPVGEAAGDDGVVFVWSPQAPRTAAKPITKSRRMNLLFIKHSLNIKNPSTLLG